MDFITIKFETADYYRDSACEVALTFVKNNEITETRSWLIKPECWPYFDDYTASFHGIKPDDVEDAPTFEELWPEILPLINGKNLIANNAGFMFSVLRANLDRYELDFPELDYACSYIFSKHVFPGLHDYSLGNICEGNGIPFDHKDNRSGPYSIAVANLCIQVFKGFNIKSFDDFPELLRTSPGKLFTNGFKPCQTRRAPRVDLDKSAFSPEEGKENPDSPFYEKRVTFTGTLSSMPRREAFQAIVDLGGEVTDRLTREVNFLIVGQQKISVVGASGLSSKEKKAAEWVKGGSEIEVVSEDFFTKNL